jgi:alpha-amylase/alpha-mannosidase (GH57 family)
VEWGIRDFQQHFQRTPEGMWLPETAVDIPTLEVLAEHGIQFTVLAPDQAQRVRHFGGKRWNSVTEQTLDTTRPYLCHLPSGGPMVLFFYHGGIAHEIAYGGLLHNGDNMVKRLISAFKEDTDSAALIHIATDGESFGHHHRHGDMALAYCLHQIETQGLARVTIYGEYLEHHPPTDEVEIREPSSWSCSHGVERWKNNCGCVLDSKLAGMQYWRQPLREALDWLRDRFSPLYEQAMASFHPDPWQLRNDYFRVVHDRDRRNVTAFIREHIGRELAHAETVYLLKLLEIQRNSMLMYTSCGWFFDDINRIEPIQLMQYAARAIQLCRDCHDIDLEPEFKSRLEAAPSCGRNFSNGREVYEAFVEPAKVDLDRVGAHVALSSVFEEHVEDVTRIYCYKAQLEGFRRLEAGAQVLITASATIESEITWQQHAIDLAVLYLGDHHLFCAVGPQGDRQEFGRLSEQLQRAFRRGDTNETLRLMNTAFGSSNYSLNHLFKDQQRRILNRLLEQTREEISRSYRQIYDHNYAIMKMVRNLNMPLPVGLAAPTAFVLNQSILKHLNSDPVDWQRLRDIAEEVTAFDVKLDQERLSLECSQRIGQWMKELTQEPENVDLLEKLSQVTDIIGPLAPDVDMQRAQNTFFRISKNHLARMKERADAQDSLAQHWVTLFRELAGHLGLAVS